MIDYTPEELTGQNLYTLCHGEDAAKLRKSHLDCKSKLQETQIIKISFTMQTPGISSERSNKISFLTVSFHFLVIIQQ